MKEQDHAKSIEKRGLQLKNWTGVQRNQNHRFTHQRQEAITPEADRGVEISIDVGIERNPFLVTNSYSARNFQN
jgi:hypothetical protein